MNMKSILCAAALLIAPIASQAAASMEFRTSQHCRGAHCAPIVLASGPITHATYDQFVAHMQTMEAEPSFIAFDSIGGNLGQALKMGVFIRALGLSTRVAQGSDCFSACVYAFIGGITRTVDAGARMGVHQFSPESEDIKVTMEDNRQVIAGVSRYTQAMNVSEHLSSLALMAPPDEINVLTADQVRMLGLDNNDQDMARAQFLASSDELRISGSSLGADREGVFTISRLSSQPGMVAIIASLIEPGLYPRVVMEKRMENPGKLMVCPAPAMQVSTAAECLFVPAAIRFTRSGDGVYTAAFMVSASDLARVMTGSSHITLAAGPEGHPPMVTLALVATGLAAKIHSMGSH